MFDFFEQCGLCSKKSFCFPAPVVAWFGKTSWSFQDIIGDTFWVELEGEGHLFKSSFSPKISY